MTEDELDDFIRQHAEHYLSEDDLTDTLRNKRDTVQMMMDRMSEDVAD